MPRLTVAASGFSVYTCLPALSAAPTTAVCAVGGVRLRTRSTSSSWISSSTESARRPCSAANASRRCHVEIGARDRLPALERHRVPDVARRR